MGFTDRPSTYIVDVKKSTRDSFAFKSGSKSVITKDNNYNWNWNPVHTTPDKLLTELVYNDQFKFNGTIIKKGSVVNVVGDHKINFDDPEHLVEVSILSTKNEDLDKVLEGNTKNVLLKKTQEGYLSSHSLRPTTGKDYFLLKEDSILFGMDDFNDEYVKAGQALAPIQDSRGYQVNRCEYENGVVEFFYLYNVIDLESQEVQKEVQLQYQNFVCTENDSLTKDEFGDISRLYNHLSYLLEDKLDIKDLVFNEWGRVRLPKNKSFRYYRGSDPKGSDTWGKPDTICQLMSVSKSWNEVCVASGMSIDQCRIQVGDISFMTPSLAKNGKDLLGHKHHHDGTCIDIRPMRSDSKSEGSKIGDDKYSTKLNKKLIDHLIANGASPIYFSDPNIVRKKTNKCNLENPEYDLGKGVLDCPGHNNHIHFCFKPDRVEGCNLN